jgi:hypothetical protein
VPVVHVNEGRCTWEFQFDDVHVKGLLLVVSPERYFVAMTPVR